VGIFVVLVPAITGPTSNGFGFNAVLLLIAIGVFATIGQLLSTDSYKYMPIATGSIIVMIAPLMNCIAGVLFFHEKLSPQAIAGCAIVLGSTWLALWKKGWEPQA
jgi:drug/metabolite transporter (DMT)-like permease